MSSTPTISLRNGRQAATIAAAGAALRSYSVDGEAVVAAPAGEDAVREFAGCVLAPWPNRLADGAWRWDGTDLRVPINEPSRGTALHGLVFDRLWTVQHQDETSAVLVIALGDDAGYPFPIHLTARYALEPDGLAVSVRARNVGGRPAPIGLGSHPYFVPRGKLDDVVLTLAATELLESDSRLLPLERRPFTAFAGGATLGDRAFDTALVRDPTRATVAMLSEGDRVVSIYAGPTSRWLMLYTGDTLPAPRRRAVIAIEPMTCPPNAFATLSDLDTIGPDEELDLSWGVRVER